MTNDTTTEAPSLQESRDRLIAALDDWTETKDPCAKGHVEHGPEAHIGRHLVHTQAGAFGADWDYEEAVAFIQSADRVVKTSGFTAALGHGGAARKDDRWVAFATKAALR